MDRRQNSALSICRILGGYWRIKHVWGSRIIFGPYRHRSHRNLRPDIQRDGIRLSAFLMWEKW